MMWSSWISHPRTLRSPVDILDESRIDILMEGCDAVVHLGSQISVQASIDDPSHTNLINVDGTEVMLRAAARHGVKRFIHASSAAVYGDEDGLPLDENQAGACLSPYAESKWQNERQLRDWRGKGLETIALRFFNVYGSGQSTGGGYAAVIPSFLHAMRSGPQSTSSVMGIKPGDFVHVSDVTRAILSALTVDWGRLEEHEFNIASGRATSLLELHQSFVNAFHHHGVIVARTHVQTCPRRGHSPFGRVNSSHAHHTWNSARDIAGTWDQGHGR